MSSHCPACGGPAGSTLAENLELGWSPCRGCGGPPAVIATLRVGDEHPLHPGWFRKPYGLLDVKLVRDGHQAVMLSLFDLLSTLPRQTPDQRVAELIGATERIQAHANAS